MQSNLHNTIIDLIALLENKETKYNYSFEEIEAKIIIKNILYTLHELRRLTK